MAHSILLYGGNWMSSAIITHWTDRVEAKVRPGVNGWDRHSSAKVGKQPCC